MFTLAFITAALLNVAAPYENAKLEVRCEKLNSGRSVCILSEEDLDRLIANNNAVSKKLDALLNSNKCKLSDVKF